MKILLTGINARYSHINPALYYLKAFTADTGHEISIKEFNINQDKTEIAEDILSDNWDAVGFSIYIWNISIALDIISIIKKNKPGIKIIIGGPEVSNSNFDFINADFIVTGAGESGFRFILEKNLQHEDKLISIPNPDFDNILFPFNEYKGMDLGGKYFYYESSRGCPFKCIYCISSSENIKTEFRNLNSVKEELDFIVRELKPSTVKFVDRTFNCSSGRHREIWNYIKTSFKNSGIIFHFEIHPDLLTEDDFDILKDYPAGLIQFEAGIQSVNKNTLSAIKRKSDWETAKRNLEKIISNGNIRLHIDLIAGLPEENFEATKHSFNEIYNLRPDYIQLGFLKILNSTEISLRTDEFEMKFNPDPPYNVYRTKWLSENDFIHLEKIEDLVNILYNNRRFKVSLDLLNEHFKSPFDMFEAIAGAAGELQHTKKWEYGAEIILNYLKLDHPGNIRFFTDALRWDWCNYSGLNNYPAILKSEFSKASRKNIFKYFNSLKNDELIFSGIKIEREDLKTAAFFSSETDEFKKKFLGENDTAVFLKNRMIIRFRK
jgi:radical SAM superfamily enzyme YgiQ (UPF0313 family)